MENKKYTLRFRTVDKKNFDMITNHKKTIETRAASVRYNHIKAGDILVIVCGKEKIQKKVKKATIFKSITAMLKKYKLQNILPGATSVKELEADYYSYPGYREKIKKFGIIALEI
jgi:ASC-1-like (ASCH) protein